MSTPPSPARCVGHNSRRTPWRIGISAPVEHWNEGNPMAAATSLSNQALSTSGDYQKFFYDGQGRRLCHIFDPSTGRTRECLSLKHGPMQRPCSLYANQVVVSGGLQVLVSRSWQATNPSNLPELPPPNSFQILSTLSEA